MGDLGSWYRQSFVRAAEEQIGSTKPVQVGSRPVVAVGVALAALGLVTLLATIFTITTGQSNSGAFGVVNPLIFLTIGLAMANYRNEATLNLDSRTYRRRKGFLPFAKELSGGFDDFSHLSFYRQTKLEGKSRIPTVYWSTALTPANPSAPAMPIPFLDAASAYVERDVAYEMASRFAARMSLPLKDADAATEALPEAPAARHLERTAKFLVQELPTPPAKSAVSVEFGPLGEVEFTLSRRVPAGTWLPILFVALPFVLVYFQRRDWESARGHLADGASAPGPLPENPAFLLVALTIVVLAVGTTVYRSRLKSRVSLSLDTLTKSTLVGSKVVSRQELPISQVLRIEQSLPQPGTNGREHLTFVTHGTDINFGEELTSADRQWLFETLRDLLPRGETA